jgi:hypothetical protein
MAACGGGSTRQSGHVSSGGAAHTATSGGLTVTMTAEPTRAKTGQSVEFVIDARETSAPGLLSYQITYGDGASDGNVVAQICRSPAPAHTTWTLHHSYDTAGEFRPSVTVTANCTSDRATATLTLAVG